MKKDVVAGLGEIGKPIFQIIKKVFPVTGFDTNKKLIPKTKKEIDNLNVRFLHICIPFGGEFIGNVKKLVKQFEPEGIVIHSTISPNTTKKLQADLDIPVVYSATRGVHRRMVKDLKSYVKFFGISNDAPNKKFAISNYKSLMKKCGIKTKQVSEPITLELSKIICDTSYYGWLINYAQISKMIASKYEVDYDEMWSFAEEIHEKLGNRPKMFPGFIGGHCVIPNLELINEKDLEQINSINKLFKKFLSSTR